MSAPPLIDGATLAAFLGGRPDAALCDLCAAAASEAVAVELDPPVPDDETWVWSAGPRLAATGVAADAYKALSAPGAGYQLDEVTYTDAFRIVSTVLRRYEPFYAASRAVGGMIG